MTRSMAAALGADGHTVNGVEAGLTESEIMDATPTEVKAAAIATTSVEKRMGTPDDITQLVVWLTSEKARWIR